MMLNQRFKSIFAIFLMLFLFSSCKKSTLPYRCEEFLTLSSLKNMTGSDFKLKSGSRGEALECIYTGKEKYTIEVEKKKMADVKSLYDGMPENIRELQSIGLYSFGFSQDSEYNLFMISSSFPDLLIVVVGPSKETVMAIANSIENGQ